MKPVPQGVLLSLILTLCALCAWQWHREGSLRRISVQQGSELETLKAASQEADARIKAANSEILRLTGTVTELRANSIPIVQQEEMQQANLQLREGIAKQQAVLTEHHQSVTKANTAMQQANGTIRQLAAERDALTKRLNEVTARYNKLAKP